MVYVNCFVIVIKNYVLGWWNKIFDWKIICLREVDVLNILM